MLKHTFLHIPGIGPATECRLWGAGFSKWEDYLEHGHRCALPQMMRDRITGCLEESSRALNAGDNRYFESLLPLGEMWRLYGELRGKTVFLDIEATGLYAGPNAITMIGLFDGLETKVFIQGINLEEFNSEIKKYGLK